MSDKPTYLGDSVYANWDNGVIEIRVGEHDAEVAVFLEPEVMVRLIKFWEKTEAVAVPAQADHGLTKEADDKVMDRIIDDATNAKGGA